MSWATEILKTVDDGKSKISQNNIFIGKALNVSPLEVEVNGQIIRKHIYINTAYQVLSDNTTGLIEKVFNDSLNISGDVDGYEKSPKDSKDKSTVDKKVDISFSENPIKAEWFEFLKEFHKKQVLIAGDRVILLKNETDFYVISKVVKI